MNNQNVQAVRLPAELAAEVELIIIVLDVSVSQFIRDSIVEHLETVRADPNFKNQAKERIAYERKILGIE